jgi:hypothetical protein
MHTHTHTHTQTHTHIHTYTNTYIFVSIFFTNIYIWGGVGWGGGCGGASVCVRGRCAFNNTEGIYIYIYKERKKSKVETCGQFFDLVTVEKRIVILLHLPSLL